MSYENVPKNKTEKAVLTRDGRPDYFKLEADPFPVPTADEAGSILEVTDTGDRYRWTSTMWVQTVSRGANSPIDINPLGELNVAVVSKHKITEMLDILFLQGRTTQTLAADTVIDSRTVTLTAGHGLTTANSAGHILEIASNTSGRFYQGAIISVAGDVVTLGSAINEVFLAASALVGTGNPNMVKDAATGVAMDGSVTPVVFTLKPLPTQAGDIANITFAITSSNDSDLTTFGGAPALSLGLLLRFKRQDGTFKNLFTYRNNFDLALHGINLIEYKPKAGNATRGLTCKIVFGALQNHSSAIRLNGSVGEELQIVISELMDATAGGNLSIRAMAQGAELV